MLNSNREEKIVSKQSLTSKEPLAAFGTKNIQNPELENVLESKEPLAAFSTSDNKKKHSEKFSKIQNQKKVKSDPVLVL